MEAPEDSPLREKPLLDEAAAIFMRLLATCECQQDRLLVVDTVRLLVLRHQ